MSAEVKIARGFAIAGGAALLATSCDSQAVSPNDAALELMNSGDTQATINITSHPSTMPMGQFIKACAQEGYFDISPDSDGVTATVALGRDGKLTVPCAPVAGEQTFVETIGSAVADGKIDGRNTPPWLDPNEDLYFENRRPGMEKHSDTPENGRKMGAGELPKYEPGDIIADASQQPELQGGEGPEPSAVVAALNIDLADGSRIEPNLQEVGELDGQVREMLGRLGISSYDFLAEAKFNLDFKNRMFFVKTNGEGAWYVFDGTQEDIISRKLVNPSQEELLAALGVQTLLAVEENLNLREGPSTNSAKVGAVSAGQLVEPVTGLPVEGGDYSWLKVRTGEAEGYIADANRNGKFGRAEYRVPADALVPPEIARDTLVDISSLPDTLQPGELASMREVMALYPGGNEEMFLEYAREQGYEVVGWNPSRLSYVLMKDGVEYGFFPDMGVNGKLSRDMLEDPNVKEEVKRGIREAITMDDLESGVVAFDGAISGSDGTKIYIFRSPDYRYGGGAAKFCQIPLTAADKKAIDRYFKRVYKLTPISPGDTVNIILDQEPLVYGSLQRRAETLANAREVGFQVVAAGELAARGVKVGRVFISTVSYNPVSGTGKPWDPLHIPWSGISLGISITNIRDFVGDSLFMPNRLSIADSEGSPLRGLYDDIGGALPVALCWTDTGEIIPSEYINLPSNS